MVRRRSALLYGGVVVLGLALIVAVVARSGGESPPTELSRARPTTTAEGERPPQTVPAAPDLDVHVSGIELVESGAGPAELPAAVEEAVVGVVASYVQRATIDPMSHGAAADGVRDLFTGAAEQRLLGDDRATLVDEGLPAARPVVRPVADLRLTALAGPSGSVELVTVGLLVDVQGETADGRTVKVNRLGELTLAPADGGWRIESYAMSVQRQVEEAA
ncbi:MAG TPA: hypothetical protein VGB14_00020 [Acidimicrobiales bacterium]